MKKILYILSIALLGATACTLHEQPEFSQQDGTVTFVMGLEFPEATVSTRGAMATNPVIDNIYVAVFGGEGYINDYVKAVPCDSNGNDKASYGDLQNGVLFYYKVTLLATSSARTVHVIANGPNKIDFYTYDYEVMPNLTTNAGEGAYWTMFSLPHGTSIKDPVTGYDKASPEAENAFRNLKLIRNFAMVSVTESADNFVLEGYKVFNTPDKGRIVTWKPNYKPVTDKDSLRWKGFYLPYVGDKDDPSTDADESTAPMTFNELVQAGYSPTLVDGAIIDQTAPTASETYVNAPQFIFERQKTNAANRPYIIIKGKFNNSSTSTFYRLDFTDKDGNYIPIFRNFKYEINISSVAKAGVANPAEAQPSNANVSALLTTANLTDLADGTSRILVQYLDKTFLDSGDIQFQYLYMPDASQPIAVGNVAEAKFRILTDTELAEEGKLPNTAEPAFTPKNGTASTTAFNSWGTTWNSTNKWQEVTLTIAAIGSQEKRTTFRIEGQTADGDKLYRDVTIHVMGKLTFDTDVTIGGSAIGSTVTVNLNLPDNLPSSVFPLQIEFEDSNKRLNPSGTDMPAKVGTSIVTGNTDSSYQFVKSVSYAEYTRNHVIPCVFKRISEGETKLYMVNEYFNLPYSTDIRAN